MGTSEFTAGGYSPVMDYSIASHPGGSRNTPSHSMETGISSGLMGYQAHMQTY